MALNNPAWKGGFKQLRGDASNPTFGIGVHDASLACHIFDPADAALDMNVSAYSDPTLLIHCSSSNAPTDYIKIWHDDTDANIDCYGATAINFGIGGTNYLEISATAIYPTTTDGVALGTSALNFSDLFLDNGGVINFNGGDVTLTHGTNALAIAGGDVTIATGTGLNIGSTSQLTLSNGDGSTNLIPEVQAIGVGAAFAGGAIVAATCSTTNDRTVSPKLCLVKGGAATQVATTAVADNEVCGSIIAYASDGADFESPVGAIEFVINGTVGAGDMPGSIEFYTTADGGETLTLAATMDTAQKTTFSGDVDVADGKTLYVGVRATPGTTAGQNWIGIEDGGTDPAGTLTNSLALYTPDAGDSLDFLHADGTTDSLGT